MAFNNGYLLRVKVLQTLRNIFLLIKLCTKTKQGKWGFCYAFIVISLKIVLIKISLEMIGWNKNFYNALEKYNLQEVVNQIGVFILLTILGAITFLMSDYLRKMTVIIWRKVLNDTILDHWINNKTYWFLNNKQDEIDNPEQRIAEDCQLFVDKLTNEGFSFITQIIGLVTYFILLWQITDNFVLSFNLLGFDISLSHYMVWLAPIYVIICSYLTHWLGNPLKSLLIQQQHKEADYRFALTRFRESKEPIALLNGEKVEREILAQHFSDIMTNWYQLIKRQLFLGCFTRPYNLTVLQIPTFFALPIYLIGKVSLGSLMQISKTFSNVVVNLSWFIFNYNNLAELTACSHRLCQFINRARLIADMHNQQRQFEKDTDTLLINNLIIKNPSGKVLLKVPELRLNKGESIILSGVSGIGKSTLFKLLSGIYPYYEGYIELPKANKLFLSQNPYFPMGGLAHAVAYPNPLLEKDLDSIKQILTEVGFLAQDIEKKLLDYDLNRLSGGEKQRLVIARILLHKPDWIFMDETTNALDKHSEHQLLKLLQTNLTNSSFIIISHSDISSYFKQCNQLIL